MVDKKIKSGVRIPASELAAVKNWHLPQVNGPHVVRSPFEQKKRDSQSVTVTQEQMDVEPLTVAAIEKLRQQSVEEGHRKGYEAGLAEGRTKGEALGHTTGLKRAEGEINALKSTLDSMMVSISAPLEQQRDELEKSLLALVFDIAKAVINTETSTRPELLKQALEETLKTLPHGSQDLSFTVNPEDLAVLETLREQENANWAIKVDAAMQRGGLFVKDVNSYVDYSIEGRYQQVVEQLLAKDTPSVSSTDESKG